MAPRRRSPVALSSVPLAIGRRPMLESSRVLLMVVECGVGSCCDQRQRGNAFELISISMAKANQQNTEFQTNKTKYQGQRKSWPLRAQPHGHRRANIFFQSAITASCFAKKRLCAFFYVHLFLCFGPNISRNLLCCNFPTCMAAHKCLRLIQYRGSD
jgi:hypothetical protein